MKPDRHEASRVLGARTLEARCRRSAILDLIFVWITIGGQILEYLVKIEISIIDIPVVHVYFNYALIAIVKGFWILGF